MSGGSERLLRVGAVVVAAAILAAWLADAATLARYPWEWDPTEGLHLDYARRLWSAPATLYPASGEVVPLPGLYTPLHAALLAPLVAVFGAPLATARWLGVACALAIAAAVFTLVRRRAGGALALTSVALVFAPGAHSVWYALARVDALLIALWLWAAVVAMPARLERGAGRLSWARALGGAALLVLAALAKPTAAVLGAPLVLGWLLVDLRSAIRFGALTVALGVAAFTALLAATHGGLWSALRLHGWSSTYPALPWLLVKGALARHGPVTALSLVAFALAHRRGERPLRDGAVLLWLAGPLSLPLLLKTGAAYNYLLPWTCAQAALTGRLLGARAPAQSAFACAAVAAALTVVAPFPLPSEEDSLTSRALHAFVAERGAPLVAVDPSYLYYLVGEPVQLEAGTFPGFANHHLPGVERLLERLERGEIRTLVEDLGAGRIVAPNYAPVATCLVRFALGARPYTVLVPAVERASVRFAFASGARCRLTPGPGS